MQGAERAIAIVSILSRCQTRLLAGQSRQSPRLTPPKAHLHLMSKKTRMFNGSQQYPTKERRSLMIPFSRKLADPPFLPTRREGRLFPENKVSNHCIVNDNSDGPPKHRGRAKKRATLQLPRPQAVHLVLRCHLRPTTLSRLLLQVHPWDTVRILQTGRI